MLHQFNCMTLAAYFLNCSEFFDLPFSSKRLTEGLRAASSAEVCLFCDTILLWPMGPPNKDNSAVKNFFFFPASAERRRSILFQSPEDLLQDQLGYLDKKQQTNKQKQQLKPTKQKHPISYLNWGQMKQSEALLWFLDPHLHVVSWGGLQSGSRGWFTLLVLCC